jgi:hypothetical protein
VAETLTIRVDLLTKHAKRALKRLRDDRNKTRTKAKSKIATATKRHAKQTMGFLGGWGAVNRVARKMRGADGQADPWTGAMVPIIATQQRGADELVGFSAKARRTARQDVVEMLADNVGHGASITRAKEVFGIRDRIRQQEEKGRNIIRQTIQGPTLDEVIVAATKGFFTLSGRAWAYVYDSLFN